MKKIFLGPPGAGKGTVASRISPIFNIPHISTGDLFRKNIKENTEIGQKAKEYMDKGLLVPDEIVIEMLRERIAEPDCEEGFILDGFPRTIPQAEMLEKIIDVDVVINLDVPDEIVITRNSARVSCKDCGKIYNLRTEEMSPNQEGICDDCDGEIIRRPDDEPEVIEKRLGIYKEQTAPLIDFYNARGILKNIPCNDINQTAEQAVEKVLEIIKEFSEDVQKNLKI